MARFCEFRYNIFDKCIYNDFSHQAISANNNARKSQILCCKLCCKLLKNNENYDAQLKRRWRLISPTLLFYISFIKILSISPS